VPHPLYPGDTEPLRGRGPGHVAGHAHLDRRHALRGLHAEPAVPAAAASEGHDAVDHGRDLGALRLRDALRGAGACGLRGSAGSPCPRHPAPSGPTSSVGGMAQMLATACVVALFARRNFAVGITLKKTEVILTALIGLVVLGEGVSAPVVAAIAVGFRRRPSSCRTRPGRSRCPGGAGVQRGLGLRPGLGAALRGFGGVLPGRDAVAARAATRSCAPPWRFWRRRWCRP
jgi:hypothetical protein